MLEMTAYTGPGIRPAEDIKTDARVVAYALQVHIARIVYWTPKKSLETKIGSDRPWKAMEGFRENEDWLSESLVKTQHSCIPIAIMKAVGIA
jgi:hypothetical protein